MPLAELYITDDTTTVDLLRDGLCLVDWRPSYPGMKGGGTWQSSPFIEGRRLAQYSYDHTVDVFTLNGHGYTQDAMIRSLQELNRLLVKARQYWATDWQDEPVYLVAKSGRETNTRYALIHSYDFPSDGAPYGQPFAKNWGHIGMDNLTLAIEHALWQSTVPGTGTCTEIFATKDYGGVTYGREHGVCPSNPGEVYVANKDCMANIDHIYWRDTTGGVWSGNLVGTMPYDLFGAAIVTGDYVIFGIETSGGAGPYTLPVFSSLVFDLVTAAVYTGVAQMNWYKSTGGPGWGAIATRDNTAAAANQPLSNAGVHSVHWDPADAPLWVEQAGGPGATVCLWVQLVATVTAPPGDSISIPRQQTRDIYHIAWPHVEIGSGDVGGDVPAIIETVLENEADDDGTDLTLWTSRVVVGLRSLGRGTDFTAYLNCSVEQNIPGVTVALGGAGPEFTWLTSPRVATGRCVLWTPGAPVAVPRVILTITLDSTLAWQWYGTFRAFVRIVRGGALAITGVQLRTTTGSGGVSYTSLVFPTPDNASPETVDLGKVVLPASVLRSDELEDQIEFAILATQTGTAFVLFVDLILIPVDEWAGDFVDAAHTSDSYTTDDREMRLDSLTYPKKISRALLARISTDQLMGIWQPIVSDRMMLQSNQDQRLWFTFTRWLNAAVTQLGDVEMAHSVDILRTQRYLSMRGDR